MRLITRAELAKRAAARWKGQYQNWDFTWKYDSGKETSYNSLLALGENPAPNDVDDVIGNGSWTDIRCDECYSHVESAMQVGEEPDYESATALICKPCLLKALEDFE